MKKNYNFCWKLFGIIFFVGFCLCILLGTVVHAAGNDKLAQEFVSPPDSAKPHTWWHWMNNYVTKEGITADLESMKRVGIGGLQVFDIFTEFQKPAGSVGYMTGQWHEMIKYSIKEADRLGLEFCFHNCAGCTNSGGPWITPEYAMKKVVWTEKQVTGPLQFADKLALPNTKNNFSLPFKELPKQTMADCNSYYRDIIVLAFPTPKSENDSNGFRLNDWKFKACFNHKKSTSASVNQDAGISDVIQKKNLVILSGMMDKAGNLTWQVPQGKWTIIRFGYALTSAINTPAPPEGRGLECDRFNPAAIELHWKNSVQKVIDDAGPLAGKVFNNVLIDSYEKKCQNWTANLPQEFKKRMGYDIMPYMPVLTGRVVESLEISERFLWDFRKVLADMFSEYYYGRFAELCHKNGLKFSVEPYGDGNFDFFAAAANADIPMGEFWTKANMPQALLWSNKLASSAAHTYGRKYAGGEAFTGLGRHNREDHPYLLKSQGDYYFCRGLNRFMFHNFTHQPWMNVMPGMTFWGYGTALNRGNTWFDKSGGWIKYLARCQYLLQEGIFVADICYYVGEDTPHSLSQERTFEPALPIGYDYDFCNTDNLMQMKVKNGIISLPSGMSYRMLALQEASNIRPEVLQKVQELVKAGVVVYGGKPEKSPSLQNYPACDNEIKKLTQELWDSGKVISQQSLAQVLQSKGILPDFEFSGGISENPIWPGLGIDYIHRKINDADVYFVSNQQSQSQIIQAVFRIKGKMPELWYPDTGKIEEAPAYSFTNDERTKVPLSFDPSGSVFVVFRKPANGDKKATETAQQSESITIDGPWTLRFPKGWGAPEQIEFDKLIDWTQHENYDIKHFSGTATYLKDFEFSAAGKQVFLDLGTVNIIAEVKLNGKNMGILWKPPFKVEITDAVKTGSNHLEIEVVNLWTNRLIGDEKYPEVDCFEWRKHPRDGWIPLRIPDWLIKGTPRPLTERKTYATWKWYDANDPLLPSGLIGPVHLIINEK